MLTNSIAVTVTHRTTFQTELLKGAPPHTPSVTGAAVHLMSLIAIRESGVTALSGGLKR